MSEPEQQPVVIVIGGPNGAGKTTSAHRLLPEELHVRAFVNADVIASGLSAFDPEGAAVEAGRIMLRRIKELGAQQKDFSFETTLASRTFAPFLRGLQSEGYRDTCITCGSAAPSFPSNAYANGSPAAATSSRMTRCADVIPGGTTTFSTSTAP